MKYWVGILTVAVVLLGIGYLNLYCCKMEFDGNSAGIIISALGVLVTALVGWQVYNAIEMRGMFEKVENVKKELDNTNSEYEHKIESLEWLVSALHGGLISKDRFNDDTAYFLHCLDVVGCYIKSGAKIDSAPFKRSLEELEDTMKIIKERNNSTEILFMGGNRDIVREWYHTAINIINTESKHLEALKARLSKVYEEYIVLTKDVVVTPRKLSKKDSQNSCHILDVLRRFLNILKVTK